MSTISAPTIVRLIRFPKTLHLDKKGNRYVAPLRRSGPVILSERHDPVECTFRLNDPGLSFATGGNTVHGVEAFNEGEQRDLLLPWTLVAEGRIRPTMIVLEIDVNYEGSAEKHTATIPIILKYGVKARVVGAVAAAAAAVAVAAVAKSRNKKTVIAADDEDVEVSLFNIAPTSRTKTTARRTDVKGAKVRVVDEEDVDLAVYNVGRRPATKKASSKKKESSLSRKKSASAKKASSKKKAPAKKAGGTRRGSSASRSAPRKGARGSSKARKAAPRRTTRKSR